MPKTKSERVFFAAFGVLATWVGMYSTLLGLIALLGTSALALILGASSNVTTMGFILSGAILLLGATATLWGFAQIKANGGVLAKTLFGIAALLAALFCLMAAIMTVATIIGFMVFLFVMLVLLSFVDWAFNTKFFTKIINAIPVIGKFATSMVKTT